MAASDLVNLSGLLDDAKCYAPGARAPLASGRALPYLRERSGDPRRMRRHAALPAALSLQGMFGALRRSHRHGAGRAPPAAAGVGAVPVNASDAQAMTEQLRRGLVAKAPAVELKGEIEIDEVYVVAGHKGQPAAVAKRGGSGGAASWQARRDAARGTRTSHRSSA